MSPLANASKASVVTPSDSTPLTSACEALWIGVAGTLTVVVADPAVAGGTTISTSVGVGLFPVKCLQVKATGTTASQILALE